MTYFVFLLIGTTICIIPSTLAELQCDLNEQEVPCQENCVADYCPSDENSDKTPCIALNPCKPQCKCIFNHRRATNGSCIPTEDCPPFDCSARPNEVYHPCPPFCPTDNCNQASPTGQCPRLFGHILIRLICRPQCRCKKGFWRNNGVCVPYEQCPHVRCSNPHETLACVTKCNPEKTCETRNLDLTCVNQDELCEEKCICVKNYYRNPSGECVLEEQC